MNGIKILVACEESQAVTKAFRARGFEAYSCDIQPCSGGHPEWHLLGDVSDYLYPLSQWDLVIAHPPCTYLCNSGVRWLFPQEGNERWEKVQQASDFFNRFLNIHAASLGKVKVAIENPIMHKHADLPKYNQIIQPYHFGHLETKATCLWLFGLPKLKPTNNVYEEVMWLPYQERAKIHYASPGSNRSKIRSKTFSGIAEAMAEQWGNYLINQKTKVA